MNPAHKASSFRFHIRLPSHCQVSQDSFWGFWAAIYLNLFSRGSMLVANRRPFMSNEPSCSLPFSCVLPKEGLRADFAIAARMLCHRSALCWAMQYDPLRFLPFQPCRGRTLLFSSRSVPLSQEPFPFYFSAILPSLLFHIGSNSLWFASRRQVYCSCLAIILAFSSQQVV